MTTIDLRADCANCAALCCVALAFDRSALFAIDKAAGEPCPHLDACGACTIHAERAERGFQGCVNFDCLGAGQRATQALFGGRSWMADRSLIGPMAEAFSGLLTAHRILSLLATAGRLDLSFADRRTLSALRRAVEDAGTQAEPLDALRPRIDAFLHGLRDYLEH
ncbi:MAG: hypothetical protein J7485_07965 [Sphingobium sp.]|nr:hypothetical protein [Sphingobium sp.]